MVIEYNSKKGNKKLLLVGLILTLIVVLPLLGYAIPLVSFMSPTPSSNSFVRNDSVEINTSINEPNLGVLVYNWNGTNHTMYNDSLVLMMNFDNISSIGENATKIVDVSKYGNNGTILGGALWNSSGKYNGAYTFDGIDDSINISDSNSLDISSQATLGVWIYVNAHKDYNFVLSKGLDAFENYEIFGMSNGNFGGDWLFSSRTTCVNITNVSTRTWNNLIIVYNGTNCLNYYNGNLIWVSPIVTGLVSNSRSLKISGEENSAGSGMMSERYFNGSIDEVRIWNRSLSSSEVYQQYISNLRKLNSSQWYLYINQSKTVNANLINGTYTYQAFVTNSSGSLNNTELRSLTVGFPAINLDWVYPTNNINVTQNQFFNVSVNVTCLYTNCGSLNLTLDPVSVTNYTFTTCGATGQNGPTQANCNTNYTNTTLQGLVGVTNGIQNWTVPTTGIYTVTAAGASGGSGQGTPGKGIIVQQNFNLVAGQVLQILVGQNGSFIAGSWSGAGGGGTFVSYINNTPIIIAGGGSGACNGGFGANGTSNFSGGGFNGGTNGSGGAGSGGGGGGGFYGNGTSGSYGAGGKAFISGGAGAPAGGFGGGGGQTNSGQNIIGGGGGYSGGSANTEMTCNPTNAGGGGSYSSTGSFAVVGNNTVGSGNGYVLISLNNTAKGGTILMNSSATPFYTNTTNPYNLTLNVNESRIITWYVNATGGLNLYNFFVYGNLTNNFSIGNQTSTKNITIVDVTPPFVNITYPLNITYSSNVSVINYTHVDINAGSCWYSNSSGAWNSSAVSAGTNFTNVRSIEGENNWTIYCNDSSGNINHTIVYFAKKIPIVGLSLISPVGDINITQNNTFQVSVSVSCLNGNCGTMNVTLDPVSANYTFTTCGATGQNGPTQANCTSNYTNTTLQGLVGITNGIQNWTVPATGNYIIEAVGARGSNTTSIGGNGSRVVGTFYLTAGTVLQILVGQKGPTHASGGGGGGGTFVANGTNYSVATPMIVAGGGGGASSSNVATSPGISAVIIINGTNGQGESNNKGTNGNGGGKGTGGYPGAGGGGFYGNGTDGYYSNTKGIAFIYGGKGGTQGTSGASGGFGGGGANGWWGSGGGGGYSGGGGGNSDNYGGGGGGSYNSGTNQTNATNLNFEDGYVRITPSGGKNGVVSMNANATPFYTLTQNPYNLSLNESEAQTITWTVNATGSINNTYTFFAYVNLTSDLTIGNLTSSWNVTITNGSYAQLICINLSNSSSYQGNISAGSGFYNVTKNISLCPGTYNTNQDMLRIQANNLTIDCNGAILQGDGGAGDIGIEINNKENITIQNCVLNNFYDGISLTSSNFGRIINNTANNNSEYGIYILSSNNVSIIRNNVTSNVIGYYLDTSSYTNFTTNRVNGSKQYGITVKGKSSSNFIYNNYFNNSINIRLDASDANNWNIIKTSSLNIIGGNYTSGNYWTNPTSSDISDSCVDSNGDGICELGYTIKNRNTDAGVLSRRDISGPNVSVFTASNNSFINGNLTIQAIATDDFGIINVLFQYKNSTINYTTLCNATVLDEGTNNIYSCLWQTRSFSNSSEGYDFRVIAFDASGNNATDIVHYVIDRSIPYSKDLTVIYPAGQYYIRNNQTLVLGINVSDAADAGISSGINNSIVDILLLNNSRNITMTFSSGSKSSSQWSWWNTSILIDSTTGQKNIPLYIRDNTIPNNVRSSDRFFVQVDNNFPTYSSLSDNGPVYNNKEITFLVNGYDNSLLAGYIFSSNITGSWINDSEVSLSGVAASIAVTKTVTTGNYSYRFFIRDNAGNINATTIRNFQVLGNIPIFSVSLFNQTDGLVLGNNNVIFTFSYYNGTATNCTLIMDGRDNDSIIAPAGNSLLQFNSTLSEGVHSWNVKCYDSEADKDTFGTSRLIIIDTLSPRISINYPENITYNRRITSINYTYYESNIYGCWYSLNNGLTNSSLMDCSNFTGVSSTEGANNWKIYIKDLANNINFSSITFFSDITSPNATLILPTNNTTSNNLSYNFTVNLTDNYGLSNVTLKVYNQTNLVNETTVTLNGNPITSTIGIVVSLIEGVYRWFYNVVDFAGNSFTTPNNTLTIDSIYPRFSNYLDNNASILVSGNGTFNVTLQNTNGTVLLEINNVNITATNLSSNIYGVNYSFVNNGTYLYRWHSWGNGTNKNYNYSELKNYFVLPPSTLGAINLDWIYPTTPINVTQNNFFNISVNVTCKNADCAEINATLDPETQESQEFCGYDYNGGNCAFTSDLCTDQYDQSLYPSGGTKDYGNTTIKVTNYTSRINSVTFKVYQTCNGPTLTFRLNGNIIGTATGNTDCSCSPNPYPHIYTITNQTLLNNYWQLNANNSFNVTLANSPAFAGFKVIVNYTTGSIKGGIVPMNANATPFYTNITNPYNLTLNVNESRIITWYVNATGATPNIPYEFYVYTNKTSNMTIQNQTSKLNITIRDVVSPRITILYPSNATYNLNVNVINYSYYDYSGGGSCWYSNSSGAWNSSAVSAGTNFTNVMSVDSLNNWTIYCNDSSGNINYSSITFNKKIPFLGISILYPLDNLNIVRNTFFNVTANISCSNGNCGNVNITLDPTGEESQEFCLYDHNGGNCAFTNSLCSDSYDTSLYPSGGTKTYTNATVRTTNISRTINSVTFKIYQTCNAPSITFFLNGITIGSTTGNTDCSCSPNPYPRLYTITNQSLLTSAWTSSGNNNFSIKLSNSPAFAGFKVIVNYTSSSAKGGTILMNSSATPFYTNTTNPYNVTLSEGEYQIINWWVNATGIPANNYPFFVYGNLTENPSVGNVSSYWNVSIINSTQIVDTTYPIFYNYSDNEGLQIGRGVGNFSVNINNTNETVWLQINNTNITASKIINNLYRVNYSFSSNASYYYLWYSYGNGNLTNINNSGIRNYTVIAADVTPPIITVISPTNSNYTTTSITINVSTNENSSWCGYSLDGAANISLVLNLDNRRANITNLTFSQGNHNIIFSCNDTSGNINSTSKTFLVDTIPPYIAFVSPSNNSYTSKSILINITNNSDARNVWFNRGIGNESYVSSTLKTFSEGLNTIYLYSNDSLGNINFTNISFFVDSVSPIITVMSPIEQTYTTSTVEFNISTNENSLCWFALNSTNNYTLQTSNNRDFNYSLILVGSPATMYSMVYYCNDSLNNLATKSINFGVKTIPPQISLNSPKLNNYYKNSSITFNFTPVASDGISTCELWGNWSGSWSRNQSFYTPTSDVSSYLTLNISDGIYQWNVWCNNTLGQSDWSTQGNITFAIDRIPPQINFASPLNLSYNVSIVTVRIENNSDAHSIWWDNGTANLSYYAPIDLGLNDGIYNYIVYANDSAGNLNSTSVFFNIDTSYPSFSNYSDNNASIIGNGLGLFNVTINNTNGTVWLQIDGINVFAANLFNGIYNATYNLTTNKTYEYIWYSYSNGTSHMLGNSESRIYLVNNTDVIAPSAELIEPNNSIYTNLTNINFTANLSDITLPSGDTESGIKNVTVMIYNSNNSLANQTTVNYSPGVLASTVGVVVRVIDGIYNWVYNVFDFAGNSFRTNNNSLIVDSTYPKISITFPENNSESSDNFITINYSTSDLNLDSCWYDNVGYYYNSRLENCSNISGLLWTEGWHNVTVYVNDSAGNINSSSVRFFTDSTLPSVNLNNPDSDFSNDSLEDLLIIFNCSATDNHDLKNISLYLTNSFNESLSLNKTSIITGPENSSNWEINLSRGNYSWSCLVADAVGNKIFSENRSLILNFTDVDGDGITDSMDHFKGNKSSIPRRGITEFNVTIGGNSSSGSFDNVKEVAFFNSSEKIVNFTYNFSAGFFDSNKMLIAMNVNYIIVNLSGQLQMGHSKTIFLEDNNFVNLCAKDAEIEDVSEISANCDGVGETNFTDCLGNNTEVTRNGLTCKELNNLISVENLKHSALLGVPARENVSIIISPSSGGGGGGGAIENNKTLSDCFKNEDCGINNYCFESKCYSRECTDNSQCREGKSCWEYRCVKLFDVKILDIDSKIGAGEYVSFTYFLKGMANISNDVIVNFWLEKDGNRVTSGKDTIFMGNMEEKTEKSKIFISKNIEPGIYDFYVSVTYDKYSAESHRQIEIDNQGNISSFSKNIFFYIIPLLLLIIILLVIITIKLNKKLRNFFEYEKERLLINRFLIRLVGFGIVVLIIILSLGFSKMLKLPQLRDYYSAINNIPPGFFLVSLILFLVLLVSFLIRSIIIKNKRKYSEVYQRKSIPKKRSSVYMEKGLKKIRTRRIKKIKKKLYKKKESEIPKPSDKLENKLKLWKKKGYDVDIIAPNNTHKKIKEWREKGYDTDSLKR